jgi:uncharacterized repeat protein (TIGR04138 family)
MPPEVSIEQIVAKVGRYPLDAFIFVQECVGAATERVHGEMNAEQKAIAKWMHDEEIGPEQLLQLASAGELPAEISMALEQAGGPQKMNRHVTGQQLCHVIGEVSRERWGFMARGVLARWNIHRTEDIGAMIFALVEHDWLQKQPDDSIDDFNHVFDFKELFDESYEIGV